MSFSAPGWSSTTRESASDEVANAIRFLTGEEIDSRLWDVTVALGAELLALLELVAELELDAVEDASEVFSAEVEEEVVVGVAEASSLSSWLAGFWQEASSSAEATKAAEYCTLRRRRGLDISAHFSSVVSVTYLIPR